MEYVFGWTFVCKSIDAAKEVNSFWQSSYLCSYLSSMILFKCFVDAIFQILVFLLHFWKKNFLEFTSKHKVCHIFAPLHWIILQKMKQWSTQWFYLKCSRKAEVYFCSFGIYFKALSFIYFCCITLNNSVKNEMMKHVIYIYTYICVCVCYILFDLII